MAVLSPSSVSGVTRNPVTRHRKLRSCHGRVRRRKLQGQPLTEGTITILDALDNVSSEEQGDFAAFFYSSGQL